MVVYICVFVARDSIRDVKVLFSAHAHLDPAPILSLISSSTRLFEVIVEPRYLKDYTASMFSSPI